MYLSIYNIESRVSMYSVLILSLNLFFWGKNSKCIYENNLIAYLLQIVSMIYASWLGSIKLQQLKENRRPFQN